MYCQHFKGQLPLEYFDDFFIFLRWVREHLGHILTVLELLSRSGMLLKLKKWVFLRLQQ